MENSLEALACPVCKKPFTLLSKYPRSLGYRLTCKCEGLRARLYLDNFAGGVDPFLPKPVAIDSPRKSRAKELLERAARLAGEEKQAA